MAHRDVDRTVKTTTSQMIEEDVVTNVEVAEEDLLLSNPSKYLLALVANGVMPKMAQLSE